MFIKSLKEFTKVKTITITAILISMSVVCDLLPINRILPNFIEITFSSLFLAVIGFLFGPIVAAIGGIIIDILECLINPTGPYMIGFTISAMLKGLIFGIFLYKKETPLRTLLATLLVNILIHACLNSFWLLIMLGDLQKYMVLIRIGKNLLLLPFEVLSIHFIIKILNKNQINKMLK